MKKLFTLLLLCTSLPALAYEYKYGESVVFTGKLQTMRGGWMAIVLDKPITVVPKPGDDDGIDTPENRREDDAAGYVVSREFPAVSAV